MELNGISNDVSVNMEGDDIVLNIVEDEKENEILFSEDGSIYIDGEKVQISTTDFSDYDANSTDADISDCLNLSANNTTTWEQNSCPYGKKADYSYKLGTVNDKDITLTAAIKNLTFTAFMSILALELGISPALSTGFGGVYTYINDCNPSTKGLSYKKTNYAHKKYHNTYIKPIKEYVYRSDYKWFPEKNFKGAVYAKACYHIRKIG